MENSAYSGKYTFFVFLTCDQKNVKSHVFLDFQKKTKKKRFLELWATAYTLERIFAQNTPKDVFPGTEVPILGHVTIFNI